MGGEDGGQGRSGGGVERERERDRRLTHGTSSGMSAMRSSVSVQSSILRAASSPSGKSLPSLSKCWAILNESCTHSLPS